MAVPTYLSEGGGDKVLCLTDAGEAAKYLAAIEVSNSPSGYGWMGIATHVEGDAVLAPGGITVTAVPLVMAGGDDGSNAKPLQVDASAFLKVILQPGSAAIGKLAANSGVDIGDVDILSLPAGNLGQQAMAASLSVVPANNIADATYIGDIKFGEALPAGTNEIGKLAAGAAAIGKLAANSGVDIGDVDILSVPAPLNVVGGGAEAPALRVTLADDSTGVVSVDDNGQSLTVDGNLGDDGPGWTPIRKYLSKSTTAAATLWNPTAARLYITDIIISISGTAVDVTLAFGAGTAMTDVFKVFHGDVRGGLTHQFRTPVKSGTDAFNLNITLSADQQMDILVLGYEKAS